jgi:hypothetical protein
MATTNRHPQVTTAVASLWRLLRRDLFDTYRPELHYMRGPGPKWRAKHQNPSQDPDVWSLSRSRRHHSQLELSSA